MDQQSYENALKKADLKNTCTLYAYLHTTFEGRRAGVMQLAWTQDIVKANQNTRVPAFDLDVSSCKKEKVSVASLTGEGTDAKLYADDEKKGTWQWLKECLE